MFSDDSLIEGSVEASSDDFQDENEVSASFFTGDEQSPRRTEKESSNASVDDSIIKSVRKKKIGAIYSDSSSDDDVEIPSPDKNYRSFEIKANVRSSTIPCKLNLEQTSADNNSYDSNLRRTTTPVKDDSNLKSEETSKSSENVINDSVEMFGLDSDVIEVSSDEGNNMNQTKILKQPTSENYIIKNSEKRTELNEYRSNTSDGSSVINDSSNKSEENDIVNLSDNLHNLSILFNEETDSQKVEVSPRTYKEQERKVQDLLYSFYTAEKTLKMVNLDVLQDKGQLLKERHKKLQESVNREQEIFKNMKMKQEEPLVPSFKAPPTWEDLQAASCAVQPRTFGKQALQTYNTQKALTMDRLEQLHGSLSGCPDENTFADEPKSLKVELMPHQKRALAWLLWRERQKPSGGILADDMGLGKTLTMLSLIVKEKEEESDNPQDENSQRNISKYKGGTLIVCPPSLVEQWQGEVKKHIKKNLLSINLYYGINRETKAKRLARNDMVITTYALVKRDSDVKGSLFNIRWRRIILDEAHQVRNHKTQTCIAICQLSAKSRWALTGTPVHNKELDLYALLKFLRCSPFDDLAVWKRWIEKKREGGQERLNTVMASLLLRRTKEQLQQKGSLDCLPEKEWNLIEVNFESQELNIYQKVLMFSRALFTQFLQQKNDRDGSNNTEFNNLQYKYGDPSGKYTNVYRKLQTMHGVKEVKQSDILVLLLRLRQICCHPSLITGMLEQNPDLDDLTIPDEQDEDNILDQLNKLTLNDDDYATKQNSVANGLSAGGEEVGLAEAAKGILNPSNPVFKKERKSSKVDAIVKLAKDITSRGDKLIIVSQWPSFLKLIGIHLKEYRISFDQFDGSLSMYKRQELVTTFNDPNSRLKVLLLSLTAGGVGLNLIGANHLLLADLHWNPQLEHQAQDRIYRVGQKKKVNVYKFMVKDSIEEKIKALQDKKVTTAEQVLTGSTSNLNKLSLNDLRMLFQV